MLGIGIKLTPTWGSALRLKFNSPLTSTDSILTPPRAAAGTTATFSRASAAYITDYQGQTRKVESGSVGVEGSRVVTNLLTYSEDLSNAAWGKIGGCTVTGTSLVNTPSANDGIYQPVTGMPSSSTYRFTVILSGAGTTVISIRDGTTTSYILKKTITLTSTPTKYSITGTIGSASTSADAYIRRLDGTTATSVTVHSAQLENVTAQQPLPGEYVKTVASPVTKCFATTNGNTVDGNGVVTEGVGSALPTSYPEWQAEHQYTINDRIQVAGWWYYATNVAGPSGAVAPTWLTGSVRYTPITISDGSMVWTLGGRLLLGYVSEGSSSNKTTAYGLIPADTLGSELITVQADREFSADTGWWTKGAGWTISGGVATFNAASLASLASSGEVLTRGKAYTITYSLTSRTSGSVKARVGGTDGTIRTTPGTYTETLVANTSGYVGFIPEANSNLSIDNVSIKEVTWAVGTKSFWTGAAFQQNITGLTLSGDTAAVLSIVTDQTEIERAGLSGINPGYKVYKLDNSAGSGESYITTSGEVGNTNKHSGFWYVRGGTGHVGMFGSDPYLTAITTSTSYKKVKYENATPPNAFQSNGILAAAGQTIFFLAPQLEESAFASSLMPTSGSTATRAATSLSYSIAGNITSPLWSAKITATPAVASQDGKYFLGSYLDANNSVGLLMSGSNVVARKRIVGSNYDATKALTLAVGTTKRFGLRGSSAGWSLFVDGVKGVDSDNTSTPAAGTTLQIGMDGNSGNIFNGYIKDLQLYNKPLADGRF